MSTNTGLQIKASTALESGVPPLDRAIAGWLLGYQSANTRDAYARDLHKWLDFCAAVDIEPFEATRGHVDAWMRTLDTEGLAVSTIARRVASVSSFYEYSVDEGMADRNPAARVRRPKVSELSNTSAPDRAELAAMLAAARCDTDRLLVLLLAINGLRVSEAIALDFEHLDRIDGHTIAKVAGKGGAVAQVPLPPRTVAVIASLGIESGPLLVTAAGARMDRHAAAYIVERLARAAGIHDKKISPHSLRHSAITVALAAGVPLHRVQDLARHADPRTTRRYDQARDSLDNHASYVVAGAID